MPYTKFKRRGNKVDVYKDGKAFTSHSPSLEAAHRTASNREAADRGTLRVAKRSKKRKRGSRK